LYFEALRQLKVGDLEVPGVFRRFPRYLFEIGVNAAEKLREGGGEESGERERA